MEFQFDNRKIPKDKPSPQSLGSCTVSSNLASLPTWVQEKITKWKTGDTFRLSSIKLVKGESVVVRKTFRLEVIEEITEPY